MRRAIRTHGHHVDRHGITGANQIFELFQAEIKIGTVANETGALRNGLLVQVGHFHEQAGRTRLRRFWVDGKLRRDREIHSVREDVFPVQRKGGAVSAQFRLGNGVAENKIPKTFRRKSAVPGLNRPTCFGPREAFAHVVASGDGNLNFFAG